MIIPDDARWFVYIVRCSDGTLYTGVTVDIARRVYAHNVGRGARYTSSRRPVTVYHSEGPMTHHEALRREREIKAMSRVEKEGLR